MPWDTSDKKRFTGNLILAVVLISGGILGAIYQGVSCYLKIKAVDEWNTVPCVINEVGMRSVRRHLYWKIVYTYEYKGQNYKTDTYNILGNRSITKEEKQQAIHNVYKDPKGPYTSGDRVECYVNPKNPAQAVLNREYSDGALVSQFIMPIALFCVGVAAMVKFVREYYC